MATPRLTDPTLRPTVLWPARWIRLLGGLLLSVGLLLPWGVIAIRTRQAVEVPSPAGQADVAALRPEMVLLPAGSFLMGSPADEVGRRADEGQHQVEIRLPFAIAVTEVTQEQYQQVMRTLPQGAAPAAESVCRPSQDTPDLPVVCVTWFEALAFCNRLSELEGLTPCYRLDGEKITWDDATCQGYRLPTEAEWEYAARAGTAQRYAGTDADDEICRYANVLDQSANTPAQPQKFNCHDGYATVAPVRRLQPNAWFLYDMTGNVAEWVWDAYTASPTSPKPEGAFDVGQRAADKVVRGGSWQSVHTARNAARAAQAPADRAPDIGFRIVRAFQQ